MKSQRWTRDDTIRALNLYCRIPFGRCSQTTPEVRSLADSLGRTPAAVAMKLVNFASLDPAHTARGVRGLSHTSDLDREVWEQAHSNWEGFVSEADRLDTSNEPSGDGAEVDWHSRVGRDAPASGSSRRGQAFFRQMILAGYGNKCCVTGIGLPELLVASHIVPWSDLPARRLDPQNGLCLMALFDRAFDRGLITVSRSYEVLLSDKLKRQLEAPIYDQFFRPYDHASISPPERWMPDPALLELHRSRYFT